MDRIDNSVGFTFQALPTMMLANAPLLRFAPTPALMPWVQCYWVLQGEAGGAERLEHRMHPDGGSSLVIELHAEPVAHLNASTRMVHERFSSQLGRIGIRFYPGGASGLLGLDIGPLLDICPSAGELGLYDFDRALEALQGATLASQLMTLDNWLLTCAQRRGARVGPVQRLLPVLLSGQLNIEQVVRTQGLSRRTLERHVRNEVGLSPAQLNRLGQIKRARQLLAEPFPPIAQVALACGFHDQAHFTHHFHRATGETPARYRHRKLTQIYKAAEQGEARMASRSIGG